MIQAVDEILRLARLCALEYAVDPAGIAAGVEALGLGFIGQVGNAECQALVATRPDGRPIVCFRGTQAFEHTSPPEIGDDLDLHRLPAPNGSGFVHRGFWRPLARLWPEVAALLPEKAPIFTGHSLGGVPAQVAPALCQGSRSQHCEVVSFGAPKGADAAFWARLYPAGTAPVRIVHEEDFAPGWSPLLPWSVQPLGPIGWLHAGRFYRVPDRTTWLNESVFDHSIDSYGRALEQIALQDRLAPRAA